MKKKPWKYEDHPLTAENLTKLEFIAARDDNPLYRRQKTVFIPRAPKCGPVIWIMKDGKPVDFTKGE